MLLSCVYLELKPIHLVDHMLNVHFLPWFELKKMDPLVFVASIIGLDYV